MISVNEAKKLIRANIENLTTIKISLENSLGYVVAEDIYSLIDFPSFVQSSVDGYALAFEDLKKKQALTIVGLVQAGDQPKLIVESMQAARIYTGAPLPKGTDTVLMQEKAIVKADQLLVLDAHLQNGSNARPIGVDIQKNELALEKGNTINAGTIGFLASLGVEEVVVFKKPSINIILTGNELQAIGSTLSYGKVFESNSHTLKAALNQLGLKDISVVQVGDSLDETIKALELSLTNFDLTLFTGGISVGDFDFVLEACIANQVEQIFHKIKQKPGKPFYVGKKGQKIVCGLPGNPASVLSCFYNYITLILDQLSSTNTEMKIVEAVSLNTYKKPTGLTHFLKGLYNAANNEVFILEGQESYKMRSFTVANCFIEIPEAVTEVEIKQRVKVHLFN